MDMASYYADGYNEDRVWATLHLDMFDSASGRSRRLFLLLSPDSVLGNTASVHPSALEKITPLDQTLWNVSTRQALIDVVPGTIAGQ